MTGQSPPVAGKRQGGRVTALAAVVVLQALCAVFFVADVVGDIDRSGMDIHTVFEAAVSVALALGVIFGGLEMRRTLEKTRRAEAALSVASGAFSELVAAYFERWGLTPAESEVALLAIKGFDTGEIAEIRGAAGGTVRAQLARIYAKADVANRTQLLSIFIEDLLAGPVGGDSAPAPGQRRSDPPN
ncbi:helix-turn-helix transcriptional regulator [Amorphus sp. 3PC139-8]|uniref:helix-turn-helix transcriptional regulator n=1 Tax=Amorphus sp. 3PC139-8 TaxID=2735676 RepID=UPI00345CAAED